MDVLTLLSGAFGGSVVGALGAAFTKWHDAKSQLKLMQLQMERDNLLNAHELKMHEAKVAADILEQEYKGLTESYGADKATYSQNGSGWLIAVDFIRGLVRPVLTVVLLAYCMATLFYLTDHYDVQLESKEVYDLVSLIVHNLVTCTGIALTWWFGSRPAKRD